MITLPENKDPLGLAVKDYYEHGINLEIKVESDIAEDDIIPSGYFFRNYQKMPSLEKEALKRCKGKILDIGAAAGCHSLYLQENGHDVTALEISTLCCDIMSKRGINKVINGNFFNQETDKYDTLLFLMNGIGIAGTLGGLEVLLGKAFTLLNKDGNLIFDSSDIDYLYYDEDGSKLINLNMNYYGELTYRMHYKKCSGNFFEWLFVDYPTLVPIAKKNGFEPQLVKKGNHYDYLAILKKVV